jgi:hypothetical protein
MPSGTSMMSSNLPFNGADANKPASKYSDEDVKQMRFHLHHP